MSDEHPVRVVLVGVAGYGRGLLAALDELPAGAAEVVAIVDPAVDQDARCDWDALRARPGTQLLTDLDQAWALSPELVILATPIHCHADQVCACLERGIDVLCEKPLAATLGEAARMQAAADASSAWCAIGYQWSFSAAMKRLLSEVHAGHFGAPKRLRTLVCWPRGEFYYSRNRWAGRCHDDAGRPVFDSPMANAAAHFLHNALEVLGPKRGVAAVPHAISVEGYRCLPPVENMDTCCLRLGVGGAEVVYQVSHATAATLHPTFVYEFEHATLTHARDSGIMVEWAGGNREHLPDPNEDPWAKVSAAVAAVRTREPPICGIATALPHLQVVASVQAVLGRGHLIESPGLETTTDETGKWWHVPGMDNTLVAGFASGHLPHELGVEWARPAVTAPVLPVA